jgi:uridine kinase
MVKSQSKKMYLCAFKNIMDMVNTIPVYCKNNNTQVDIPCGITLQEFLGLANMKQNPETPFLGALVNNKERDMSFRLTKPAQVHFFDYYSTYGRNGYMRSLFFLLFHAVDKLLPKEVKLHIKHSISGGRYCTLENMDVPITEQLVQKLFLYMKDTAQRDLPFIREEMLTQDAIAAFQAHGLEDKYEFFKNRDRIYTSVYHLADSINYYYGFLVPSTGYLTTFGLERYEEGLLLKLPSKKNIKAMAKTRNYPKLFSVYKMDKEWVASMGVPYVSDLNKYTSAKQMIQAGVLVAEAYQEKHLARVADKIYQSGNVKMVLISGPSSSGKTTTCRRLSVQLAVLGYHPVQISVDDFFVERDDTPKDENGEFDFEDLHAIDLSLFNSTLKRLLAGEEVEIPTFDFTQGKKVWNGNTLKLRKNSILVIEGIHCLNPELTEQVPDEVKFKIFVSALTSLSLDRQNPIPTSDNRLIRRIVRDFNYRGYSAVDTIRRWPSVRRGEEKNIFPYQENADVMINTSLVFELSVLKPFALPILYAVPETAPEYAEAQRLIKMLLFFKTIPEFSLPGTSILREFLGGSKFTY